MRTLLAAAIAGFMALASPAAAQTKMTIATGVDPSFSAYYVAKLAGIFEKNGLDVTVNTGPSGSAMVSFLVRNQVQSAFGAEGAGVQNHNLDPNVVVAAEGDLMKEWYGMVAKGVPNLEALKGKKLGIARGSGSEVFWLSMVEKLKLNPKDYKIIQVEAPEMVAALERGDIDAFTAWEPWLARATKAVPGAKVIVPQGEILTPRVYIYVNKEWADKNPAPATAFMKSMVEATDLINKEPEKAADHVAAFLKLDKELTRELMPKLRFDVRLDQDSLSNFIVIQKQLKDMGKLAKEVDFQKFVYPDLLKKVRPEKVTYSLPATN
jgi:NitT/TauT family transport system substrate-binding protein